MKKLQAAFKIVFGICLLTTSVITLYSCVSEESSGVDQTRIFTTYEVFYDANTDISYARAQFRFGGAAGTTLRLSSPAQVTFNNEVLTFNETLAFYEKQVPGFVDGGTFKYTDAKSSTLTNSISGLLKPTIPASFIEVDRSIANTFTWTGAPLGERETILLDIYNTGQTNFQFFSQSAKGSTTILLPTNQTANLASGTNNAIAVLDWSRTDELQAATAVGGNIKVSSRDKSKTISVKN